MKCSTTVLTKQMLSQKRKEQETERKRLREGAGEGEGDDEGQGHGHSHSHSRRNILGPAALDVLAGPVARSDLLETSSVLSPSLASVSVSKSSVSERKSTGRSLLPKFLRKNKLEKKGSKQKGAPTIQSLWIDKNGAPGEAPASNLMTGQKPLKGNSMTKTLSDSKALGTTLSYKKPYNLKRLESNVGSSPGWVYEAGRGQTFAYEKPGKFADIHRRGRRAPGL